MPRVICALPNASDEISGVKFTPLEDGRLISEEISDEAVNAFASITGYTLDDGEDIPPAPVNPPAPTLTKAQQKAADKKAPADKTGAAAVEVF